MKSTRENYLEYFMLPSPLNPFVAEYDAPNGYTTTWWSFEEALESVIGGTIDDLVAATLEFAPGTTVSEKMATWSADAVTTGPDRRDATGYASTESGLWGAEVSADGKTLYTGTTAEAGASAYTRAALGGAGGSLGGTAVSIDNFFPDVSTVGSWSDGQNHISKMTNTGIYYAVPPITSKGFLKHTKPFALASKNAFSKKTDTGFEYINPCPGCKTIGRANNGWHEMKAFFYGATSIIPRYWMDEADADAPYGLRNPFLDMSSILDMEPLDLTGGTTYGSGAFTSFYIYEVWYAILTTYSADDSFSSDDILTLSYYHTQALARRLTYGSNIIYSGGYPDNTSLSNTDAPVSDRLLLGGTPGAVHSNLSPRDGQSEVTSIPWVLNSDNATSLAAKGFISALGGGGDTALESATDGGHITVCYLNNRFSYPAGKIVIGDVMRRFQRKTDTADGDYQRIGSYTLAKGFLANKAWLLQNSLTIWNGKLENMVHQQVTRNLDIDLMHPVGDSPDSTSYTSSPSAPMTTTPGDSSY